MIYDLAIIGGGPAGVAAGVYAARKRLRTVFITADFESQSVVSDNIQNWIGTPSISGRDFVNSLQRHLEMYAGDTLLLRKGEYVTDIKKHGDIFTISSDNGGKTAQYEAKTVLLTTGGKRRQLQVPGAAEFEHKGLTYCASCDGPLFAGQDVAVIGGGNAGFETAAQLLAYAKSVTLLHTNPEFKADAITVEKVLAHPHMKALTNAETQKIFGEKFVKGLVYKDTKTGEEKTLDVTGVFVEIGLIPSTGFVKDLVTLNEFGQVKVDPRTQATSMTGIWAAGDCTDGLYHQNNIAAGDAVKALEDIYLFLNA